MKNILLVDDDASFLQSLAEGFMAFSPYNVLTADNGQSALHMLSHNTIHLVVTDLRMPEMGGIALITHMREHSPSIPVVVMTAYKSLQLPEELDQSGTVCVLEKPIDFNSLCSIIDGAMSGEERDDFFDVYSGLESMQLQEMISESVGSGLSGEMVVTCGEKIGKLFFFQNRITGVMASNVTSNLIEMISERTQISKVKLVSLSNMCRQTGKHLGETLVSRGYVSPYVLHEVLLSSFADALREIVSWGEIDVMVHPLYGHKAGPLTFTVEEIFAKTGLQ